MGQVYASGGICYEVRDLNGGLGLTWRKENWVFAFRTVTLGKVKNFIDLFRQLFVPSPNSGR